MANEQIKVKARIWVAWARNSKIYHVLRLMPLDIGDGITIQTESNITLCGRQAGSWILTSLPLIPIYAPEHGLCKQCERVLKIVLGT